MVLEDRRGIGIHNPPVLIVSKVALTRLSQGGTDLDDWQVQSQAPDHTLP